MSDTPDRIRDPVAREVARRVRVARDVWPQLRHLAAEVGWWAALEAVGTDRREELLMRSALLRFRLWRNIRLRLRTTPMSIGRRASTRRAPW